jgi:hypothetical protein
VKKLTQSRTAILYKGEVCEFHKKLLYIGNFLIVIDIDKKVIENPKLTVIKNKQF